MRFKNYVSYISSLTYNVGTQKNRLNENPKHMLKRLGKKILTILRSKNYLNLEIYYYNCQMHFKKLIYHVVNSILKVGEKCIWIFVCTVVRIDKSSYNG